MKKIIMIFIFFSVPFLLINAFTEENKNELQPSIEARVTEVRRNGYVGLSFPQKPGRAEYYVWEKEKVIGTITLLSVREPDKTGAWHCVGHFRASDSKYVSYLRSGSPVVLMVDPMAEEHEYPVRGYREHEDYPVHITNPVTNREMILIPEGKFRMGSNRHDPEESPESVRYLDDYYIDVYEVTNKDYLKFIKATSSAAPRSWNSESFPEGRGDLPVCVTYSEALAYAKWAGVRLPTEEEWEKAARGLLSEKNRTYPWGDNFSPQMANTADFWNDNTVTLDIKKLLSDKYGIRSAGAVPVDFFSETDRSPFGVVGMSGNVMEWTSSWYRAYKGCTYQNRRFGNIYKTIRGGSWLSKASDCRLTCRQIGGIPNLEEDFAAGFRCVKNAEIYKGEGKKR